MSLIKAGRIIAIILLFTIILSLPIFNEVYYTGFYYAVTIIFIPVVLYGIIREEQIEKKFYMRWRKARKQGLWINVVREGLRSFVYIVVVVCLSQLFDKGITPLQIVSILSSRQLIWILLLFLAFGLLIGIVAWYENNKRYHRIHDKVKNTNI